MMPKYFMSQFHDLLATYIEMFYDETEAPVTKFLTAPEHSIQVGYLSRPKGTSIASHQHKPTSKVVQGCQEVLLVRKGRLQVSIYDVQGNFVASQMLKAGSIFIQYKGGHSFFAPEDVSFVEIKQGPYTPEDKVYFNPVLHENMK